MIAITNIAFSELLQEYFRSKLHPRCAEIARLYPQLWNNSSISIKLLKKYPSTRMSDIEYHQFWREQLNIPSIFTKLTFHKNYTESVPLEFTK
jgi:hypothetical protein